jgi:divalent metal cation (Fe/Co/Zn/Cd) transporter
MARLKIKYGKEENSVSLISDGLHSRIDVWRSVAVFFGLILTNYYPLADQIIAGVVGLYIIKESFHLGREATDSLLDISADEEDENRIKKIIEKKNVQLTDLKTQKKGSIITADLKVKLSPDIKVKEATQIINKLEQELIEEIDKLEFVSIQIDSKEIDFSTSYFKSKEPILRGSAGFGWRSNKEDGEGKGPEGDCVCPDCDYKQAHKRGTPCSKIKCPECGSYLKRG